MKEWMKDFQKRHDLSVELVSAGLDAEHPSKRIVTWKNNGHGDECSTHDDDAAEVMAAFGVNSDEYDLHVCEPVMLRFDRNFGHETSDMQVEAKVKEMATKFAPNIEVWDAEYEAGFAEGLSKSCQDRGVAQYVADLVGRQVTEIHAAAMMN